MVIMMEYKNPKPCTDCGRMTTYRNRKGRCIDCAHTAMLDSTRQIHRKEGEYYKRYLKGPKKALKRMEGK